MAPVGKFIRKQSLILQILAPLALLLISFSFGIFRQFSYQLSDQLFRVKPFAEELVIIEIDEPSLQEIGQWPWNREIHAQLLNNLTNAGVEVTAFDVSFFDETSQDQQLAAEILEADQEGNEVVLASELFFDDSSVEEVLPREDFRDYGHYGYVNLLADANGIVRRVPFAYQIADTTTCLTPSFSFVVLELMQKISVDQICGEAKFTNLPVEGDNLLRINYSTSFTELTHYSYVDVLNGKVPSQLLNDKVVLIGATAKNLHDERLTPISNENVPGVYIHANAINTVLQQSYLQPASDLINTLIITLFGLAAFISFKRREIFGALIVCASLLLIFWLLAFILFDLGYIIDLVYPPLAVIGVFVTFYLVNYVLQLKYEQQVKKAFSQYVSPAVLNEVLSNLDNLLLGGQRKEMTVMFSDIRGFTSLSEQMEPQSFVELLNGYLSAMSGIILQHSGVIDKYIGDAIMAFWGAPVDNPDHADQAVAAAVSQIKRLREFNQAHAEFPDLAIGIGLNSGEMTVGNMGSNERFDYTIIGDNVNLGARLEGLTKLYGVEIIISEFTKNKLTAEFEICKLDRVKVKGKSKAVDIYAVFVDEEDNQIQLSEQLVNAYLAGEWAQAQGLMKKFTELPLRLELLNDRMKMLNYEVPDDWNGSWKLTQK